MVLYRNVTHTTARQGMSLLLFRFVYPLSSVGSSDQPHGFWHLFFFLSLISRSNSCKSKIHLINLGLDSFFFKRYLKAAWSVKMTYAPSKYDLNFSRANTTTKSSFSVVW